MLAPSVEPQSARGCGEESSHFQVAFGPLLLCLGDQFAAWAVAHRFCRVGCKILLEGVTIYRARPRCGREHFANSAPRSPSHL